jgi:hypothetical protein
MKEFFEFSDHPLAVEIQKRASSVITMLDTNQYSIQALYDGQEQLLDELLWVEDNQRSTHDKLRMLNKEASEIALNAKQSKGNLSDDEKSTIKNIQLQASDLKIEISILKYGRWLFRYIGDGIAWRAYDFQRNIIRALGDKESVPFMSNKGGIDKERRFFRGIRNLGQDWLPLMHDITNCLRTADFSVFHAGELERIIELKIKGSKKGGGNTDHQHRLDRRGERQTKRAQNIIDFMETGNLGKLRSELAGGKYIYSEQYEKHNFAAISNVIQSWRETGYGFEELEHGLLYLAFDTAKRSEDQALREASEIHPHIFNSLFTFRSICPRFEENHLSLPITAMDLPSNDIIDILFRKTAVICIANYSCLEDYCKSKGIDLSIKKESDGSLNISVAIENGYVRVMEGIWDKLMLEGLSLETFAGLTQTVIENVEQNQLDV